MNRHGIEDTIAAAATAPGESGIGIIRISGAGALSVAGAVFACPSGRSPASFKSHTIHYGWITDAAGARIDEVLLTMMRAPGTYTREDVVEINCHGGLLAMRRVLERVLESGCRIAEPGEFTRRAFTNGRIDLAQAEAVLDVIRAKTDAALKAGVAQLKGKLSSELGRVSSRLLEALAELEAGIDFCEEGVDARNDGLSAKVRECADRLERVLDGCRRGRVLREGIKTVICGKANAGKSSLLNALLREERSLVTPIAGTTRDTIEEVIDIRGIPVRIVDTAGILEPRDLVEKKALERTRRSIGEADLVILVFDGARKLDADDRLLMRRLKGKNVIPVINKTDLKARVDRDAIAASFGEPVGLCAKSGKNIHGLEEAVVQAVCKGTEAPFAGAVFLSNQRHIQAVKKIKKLVEEAGDCLDNKLPPEFCAQNIKDAVAMLDELLGRRFSEELLDRIFSRFCIGK
jgi:tRNA modification GTPase